MQTEQTSTSKQVKRKVEITGHKKWIIYRYKKILFTTGKTSVCYQLNIISKPNIR